MKQGGVRGELWIWIVIWAITWMVVPFTKDGRGMGTRWKGNGEFSCAWWVWGAYGTRPYTCPILGTLLLWWHSRTSCPSTFPQDTKYTAGSHLFMIMSSRQHTLSARLHDLCHLDLNLQDLVIKLRVDFILPAGTWYTGPIPISQTEKQFLKTNLMLEPAPEIQAESER